MRVQSAKACETIEGAEVAWVGAGAPAYPILAKQEKLFDGAGRLSGLALILVVMLTPLTAQNLSYQQDSKWQAPPEAVAKVNPLAGKTQLAAGGKKIFLRDCAQCHRTDGTGLQSAANLTLPVVQQQSDGALFWKITQGNPGRKMPSASGLPDMQRWQIVLFLRTLNASGAANK